MLNKKVIATEVTNLTDARYFAARGVQYLLFDLDNISIQKILEIKEWVEGPEILLLFSSNSVDFLDESVIRTAPTAIAAKDGITTSELAHLAPHISFFDWTPEHIYLGDTEFQKVIHPNELDGLDSLAGVILSGEIEDQVGIKDFDNMDSILDRIEVA